MTIRGIESNRFNRIACDALFGVTVNPQKARRK